MQGLFRNPLADPGLVGVSSGASLGAVLLIVLGTATFGPLFALFGFYALPVAAFFGGLVTTLLLYRIATRGGQTSIATPASVGIALGALTGAVTGVLVFMADDKQLRDLTFWGLGCWPAPTGRRSRHRRRSSCFRSPSRRPLPAASTRSHLARQPPSTWAFLSSG